MGIRKIDRVISKVIADNPREREKFQHGDNSVISFFLGETLKEIKSRNLKETKEKIIECLESM